MESDDYVVMEVDDATFATSYTFKVFDIGYFGI